MGGIWVPGFAEKDDAKVYDFGILDEVGPQIRIPIGGLAFVDQDPCDDTRRCTRRIAISFDLSRETVCQSWVICEGLRSVAPSVEGVYRMIRMFLLDVSMQQMS